MAKLADIVFTLDTTGSMGFAIEGMKRTITQLADIYLEARVDTRLGVIQFRDRSFGELDNGYPTLQREAFAEGEFTNDAKEFRDRVSWYKAAGGGPTPESSFDALALASRSAWRDEANRIIIHITDAPPRIPDAEIKDVRRLVDMLSDAYIDQLHMVVPEAYMEPYEPLAEVRSDGVEGSRFAGVTWTSITSDVEDIVDKLRKIAKTSSGNIVDKSELIFRDSDEELAESTDEDEPMPHPFETEEELTEDDHIHEDDENPFDDLD